MRAQRLHLLVDRALQQLGRIPARDAGEAERRQRLLQRRRPRAETCCRAPCPRKPASLASARQVSSGVSPPSSGRSSFDQPMGLAPMRIVMSRSFCIASVVDALRVERVLVGLPRGPHLRALGDFRHRHVPPMPAGVGRGERIGVDDDDASCASALRASRRAASSAATPSTLRAIAPRLAAWAAKSIAGSVSCRVCCRRLLKLSPPVARCRRLMQP